MAGTHVHDTFHEPVFGQAEPQLSSEHPPAPTDEPDASTQAGGRGPETPQTSPCRGDLCLTIRFW